MGKWGVSRWRRVPVRWRYQCTVRGDPGYRRGVVATADVLWRWTRQQGVIPRAANTANATTVQQQAIVTAHVMNTSNSVPRALLQRGSHNRRRSPMVPVMDRRTHPITVKQPVQLPVQRIPQIRRVELPNYGRSQTGRIIGLGLLYHTGVGRLNRVGSAITAAAVAVATTAR